jgi:hypothetical protein
MELGGERMIDYCLGCSLYLKDKHQKEEEANFKAVITNEGQKMIDDAFNSLIFDVMEDAIVKAESYETIDWENGGYKTKVFILPANLPQNTKQELKRRFKCIYFDDEIMDLVPTIRMYWR